MYRRGCALFHNKWAIHVSPRLRPLSQQVDDSCIATVATASQKVGVKDYDIRCNRGSAKNNVFFVGLGGYITHYNGASFKVFNEFAGQGIGFTKAVVFENEVSIICSFPLLGGMFVHGRRR